MDELDAARKEYGFEDEVLFAMYGQVASARALRKAAEQLGQIALAIHELGFHINPSAHGP